MNYTTCSKCGQNALPVATRCPRCGNPFEDQFMGRAVSPPKRRRAPLALLVVGAALALFLANVLMKQLETPTKREGMAPAPAVVPKAAPRPKPKPKPEPPSQAAVAESLPISPAPEPKPTARTEVPAPTLPSKPETLATRALVPAPTTPASAVRMEERRYASTWINVRAARLNSAPVIRILRPGEAVRVDSLAQGWYRVISNQAAAGYVDRRLLDTVPLPASP